MQSEIQPEVISESDVSAALDQAIKKLLCECFPADVGVFSMTRAWHGSVPTYSVILRQDDVVLAHVGMVTREIQCGGDAVLVVGVQNMAVQPEKRGTGLSGQILMEALHEARGRGIAFGLLFCIPELESLYQSMGWSRTSVDVTMEDGDGQPVALPAGNIAMQIELREERFPPGAIHLCGADW